MEIDCVAVKSLTGISWPSMFRILSETTSDATLSHVNTNDHINKYNDTMK